MDSTSTPAVHPEDLDDLRRRLDTSRVIESKAPTRGISATRLGDLVEAWRHFEWQRVENVLRELGSAVSSTVDGRQLHFLRRRGSSSEKLPVLFLHGWPDTPLTFRKLLPLLADAGHDVVAPSLPGFGWSEEHAEESSAAKAAADVHRLMLDLGYDRYAVHGTDWGATVGSELALAQPDHVAALHLLQPPFDRAFLIDRSTATEAELVFLNDLDAWGESAAYVSVHLHQADTLAAALNDSPVGLLAWLAEKYDAWSGDALDDEDILIATTTMWLTKTFRSSIRLYSEPSDAWGGDGDEGSESWSADGAGEGWAAARVEAPTAFAIFPDDISQPPREFVERFFDVRRFTTMTRGGHWAALEEPNTVARDLVAYLESVDAGVQ